jgi:hypothetical protein
MADVTPITRVLDVDGTVLHDCKASGCLVSWDGYVIATGERVEGGADPSDDWDVSTAGTANRTEPQG